jgi:ABC-type iron transport system FetAB permease component
LCKVKLAAAGTDLRLVYVLFSLKFLMTHKEKWLVFAPAGLMVIGLGNCLVQWAADKKRNGYSTKEWVAAGTAALVVFNVGVSLFGRSVVEKVKYDLQEKPAELDYNNVARL